jgi:ferredoxin-NADP reductase
MTLETQKRSQRQVAFGTYEVMFKRPSGFSFKPGQYTQVGLPSLTVADPKGRSRQFSIASNPDDVSTVSVVFRATGSGFKESLLLLPSGSTVVLEQAAGSFLLPSEPSQPLVFVAGGVGISPFMSYFRYMSGKSLIQPITLLYGNRNRESAAFLDELGAFATSHPQLRLQEMYEPPTPELFAEHAQHITKNATWFVVGPPGLVATAVYGLERGGVHPNSIIQESFQGYL